MTCPHCGASLRPGLVTCECGTSVHAYRGTATVLIDYLPEAIAPAWSDLLLAARWEACLERSPV